MSFGQSGWENMDDYESAGSGQRKLTGPKRFWLPAGVTKKDSIPGRRTLYVLRALALGDYKEII